MHRSGTSATTGLLSYFEIGLGRALIKPNIENPKGFFENKAILDLNKKILSTVNSNWDDYHFNLNNIESSQIEAWVQEAHAVLQQEFFNCENFAIKDPRLCLLFPIWEAAISNFNAKIKVIMVNRHPSAVAASLETRNDFSYQKSLILWAKYSLSLEFYSRGYDRLLIQYPSNFIKTPELISKFENFTSLSISDEQRQKGLEFFENALMRHQTNQELITKDTPPLFAQFSNLLESGDISNNIVFDSIYKELDIMLNFFSDQHIISEKNAELSKKSTQIRQRNERITRLTSDIDDIETAISHRIVKNDADIHELKQKLSVLQQKLSETTLQAIQFSNRTSELAQTYLRDREKNSSLKGLYKHKKDKRLMQKVNRLQLRLRAKLDEIHSSDYGKDEQKQ